MGRETSDPLWQYVGEPHYSKIRGYEFRPDTTVYSGSIPATCSLNSHVCPYNWAEGSRAIEARREASDMRTDEYDRREREKMSSMLHLNMLLAQLGVPPEGWDPLPPYKVPFIYDDIGWKARIRGIISSGV